MNVLSKLRALFAGAQPKPLQSDTRSTPLIEWFIVSFDDEAVHMRAKPPEKPAWSQSFRWDSVIRVCFGAEDVLVSDGIYVFTTQRPESYAIPMEGRGGAELWSEILRRKLFDAELAIKAAFADRGLYCWPPPEVAR